MIVFQLNSQSECSLIQNDYQSFPILFPQCRKNIGHDYDVVTDPRVFSQFVSKDLGKDCDTT